MSKFTAGPWINDDFEIASKADPANLIASLYAVEKDGSGGYYLGEEFKANAKLIAAAPDLLESAQALSEAWAKFIDSFDYVPGIGDRAEDIEFQEMARLRSAIAKALA